MFNYTKMDEKYIFYGIILSKKRSKQDTILTNFKNTMLIKRSQTYNKIVYVICAVYMMFWCSQSVIIKTESE
jgi:hypothetical protein